MKVILAIFAVLVAVECDHFMLGTNVGRPKIYGELVSKTAHENRHRSQTVEYNASTVIQGILAYDTRGTNATVQLLSGGIGYNHTQLKLRGEKSKSLSYKVYIYG